MREVPKGCTAAGGAVRDKRRTNTLGTPRSSTEPRKGPTPMTTNLYGSEILILPGS